MRYNYPTVTPGRDSNSREFSCCINKPERRCNTRNNAPSETIRSSVPVATRCHTNPNTVTRRRLIPIVTLMTRHLNKHKHPLKREHGNKGVGDREFNYAAARVADLCTAGLSASWPAAGENRTWPIPNTGTITPSQKPRRGLSETGREVCWHGKRSLRHKVKPRKGRRRKKKWPGLEPTLLNIPQNQWFPFCFPPTVPPWTFVLPLLQSLAWQTWEAGTQNTHKAFLYNIFLKFNCGRKSTEKLTATHHHPVADQL